MNIYKGYFQGVVIKLVYMKHVFKFISIFSFLTFTPVIAFAATSDGCGTGITSIICKVNNLLDVILPFIIALGVLYFVWGIVQYMIADSDEAKTKGKDKIIYGIIGLAVIVSVWGLVALVNQTFGLGGETGLEVIGAPDSVSGLVATTGKGACPDLSQVNLKLQGVLEYFTCAIGKSVVPFLFALAVVMFAWGVIKYFIINPEDQEKRAQGKQFILWGVIALAVMVSVWGLVAVLGATFGLDTSFIPEVRKVAP